MCLAVPMKIKKINVGFADVSLGKISRRINIELLPKVKAGDYVMVHAGFAIQKIDPEEAKKTIELIAQLSAVTD